MKWIVFILALLTVWYMTKPEMGMYTSSDSEYIQSVATVSNDLNQTLIFATQDYITKHMKLCVYCIETKEIKQLTNKNDKSIKYRCVYMFRVLGGYAYGFTVQADIALNKDGSVTVLLLNTQPNSVASDAVIHPYTDEVGKTFLNYNEIAASIQPIKLPTINK